MKRILVPTDFSPQAENKPKMKAMIKTVMVEERKLMQEALGADVDTVGKAQTMLDTRKNIIKMKTLCRAHLKTVLTPKQFKQLVGIYRSTLPMNHKKAHCKK